MRGRSERWVDLYNAKEVSVKEYVRRTSYPQLRLEESDNQEAAN